MNIDVLIVGGGLSGLGLARRLEAAGVDYRLVESRDRLGGRILSETVTGSGRDGARFDLGPAWFWPDQPRMAALASALGLTVFEQHAAGRLVFEDRDGAIRRDLDFATMGGSLRIEGGVAEIVEGLARALPPERVLLGHALYALRAGEASVDADVLTGAGPVRITAGRVVLALPPRLAACTIRFEPELPRAALASMSAIPTWMAGHAKAVAVYERPFWREAGLSGDAISHRGPLVEIHDASPESLECGALFGFVGLPPAARRSLGDGLADAVASQLSGLFGAEAGDPVGVLVKDWADERFTATPDDEVGPSQHPAYGLPPVLRGLWGGRIVLGSTEAAPGYGGFLEGALEAAEAVLEALLQPGDRPAANPTGAGARG